MAATGKGGGGGGRPCGHDYHLRLASLQARVPPPSHAFFLAVQMEGVGHGLCASLEACPGEAGEAYQALDHRDPAARGEEHSAAGAAGKQTWGTACGCRAYERRSSGCLYGTA